MKLLIKGDKRTRSRVYNKIFNICDKYTTFFKTETDNEYETVDWYVVEFDCPPDAEFEISELKNVDMIWIKSQWIQVFMWNGKENYNV